jgi:HAMP domain-containing protein
MLDCALLKNASLFRFQLRGWGNVRQMPLTREAVADQIGPRGPFMSDEEWEKKITDAAKQLRASKRLVVSKAFDDVIAFQAETRDRLLRSYCNQSFIEAGWYTVSRNAIEAVKGEVERAQAELARLVQEFVYGDYEKAVTRAAEVLGAAYSTKDYPPPEKLARMFGMEYRFLQFDVPDGLPPEIRAEEEQKLRESYQRASDAITTALWSEFNTFVSEIERKLTVEEGGKPKVFRNTLFEDLTTFVKSFANRNTFNDERLQELVQKAEGIVAKVGGGTLEEKAQRMRDFEGLREQTKRAMDALKSEVAAAIQEKPERRFDFDE